MRFRPPFLRGVPGRGLPTEVVVLSAVAFAVAVGFGVVAPAIPVFAREFGVGRAAAGAVVSAFALMRLAFALGAGRLVDLLGERLMLAAGIAIVAVSSALAGLAQSYEQLLLLRGAGGIGSALFTVSAMALLLRVSGADQRGRALGWFQAGFLVGGVVGPAFGGVLTSVSLRAPFFVYAATLGLAGTIALAFLTNAPPSTNHGPAEGPKPERTRFTSAVRNAAYRAALVANLGTGWLLFGLRYSLLPLFVVEGLRRDPVWTGIGLVTSSVMQVVCLPAAGRFTDRRGRRPALLIGTSTSVVSVALLAVDPGLVTYLLAMILFGLASAFLGVAAAAVVGDIAGGRRGGTVVASFQMAADIGAVIGPLVAGWLADSVSYGAAWGVTAGVIGLGVAMALRMPETRTVTRSGEGPPRSGPTSG